MSRVIAQSQLIPGDAVLVDSRGFIPWLIKLGQYLRWKKYRQFSHAAIVTSVIDGNVKCVEMEWPVGKVCSLSDLLAAKRCVFIGAPEGIDRGRAVAYASTQVGTRYGILSIISIAFNVLTPRALRVDFRRDNTLICSALVAYAWIHGGWFSPLGDPFETTPAELAEWALE